jgi:hypothetical protein
MRGRVTHVKRRDNLCEHFEKLNEHWCSLTTCLFDLLTLCYLFLFFIVSVFSSAEEVRGNR